MSELRDASHLTHSCSRVTVLTITSCSLEDCTALTVTSQIIIGLNSLIQHSSTHISLFTHSLPAEVMKIVKELASWSLSLDTHLSPLMAVMWWSPDDGLIRNRCVSQRMMICEVSDCDLLCCHSVTAVVERDGHSLTHTVQQAAAWAVCTYLDSGDVTVIYSLTSLHCSCINLARYQPT